MKSLALVLVLGLAAVGCQKKYTQAELEQNYNDGYTDGNADGYDDGYDDGYADGFGAAESRAILAANLAAELGKQFGPSGLTLELVKFGRDNANYAVFKATQSGTTLYVAVDVSGWTTGADWATYASASGRVYANLVANGDGTFSCGAGCMGYGGTSASTTMVFEKTTGSSKDLEKAAAIAEAYAVETMSSNLAAEFGLSEERALKVAKLAKSWEKLSKTRALTNADADAFAKELAGVTISDMQNAYERVTEGSVSEMNAVLEKAAAVNGTSSENMAVIMTKLFL